MCRLAAFPPHFSPSKALTIMKDMVGGNDDGVGTCYLNGNHFVINKVPYALDKALEKKVPLFDHMPYGGWTIAHVRAATHGEKTPQNTHPIHRGNYCVVHNGVWSESENFRKALTPGVKFRGETDSEVAAYLFDKLGPKEFDSFMQRYHGGVFMGLHRSGELHIVKTSGDLVFTQQDDGEWDPEDFPKGKTVVASELGQYRHARDGGTGLYILNPDGTFKSRIAKFQPWERYQYRHGYQGGGSCGIPFRDKAGTTGNGKGNCNSTDGTTSAGDSGVKPLPGTTGHSYTMVKGKLRRVIHVSEARLFGDWEDVLAG